MTGGGGGGSRTEELGCGVGGEKLSVVTWGRGVTRTRE